MVGWKSVISVTERCHLVVYANKEGKKETNESMEGGFSAGVDTLLFDGMNLMVSKVRAGGMIELRGRRP